MSSATYARSALSFNDLSFNGALILSQFEQVSTIGRPKERLYVCMTSKIDILLFYQVSTFGEKACTFSSLTVLKTDKLDTQENNGILLLEKNKCVRGSVDIFHWELCMFSSQVTVLRAFMSAFLQTFTLSR